MDNGFPLRQSPLPPSVWNFRWLVGAAGLVLTLAAILANPGLHLWGGLLVLLFTAWPVLFPIRLLGGEIILIQSVALGSALILGPATSSLAVAAGVLVGTVLRWTFIEGRRAGGTRRQMLPALPQPPSGLRTWWDAWANPWAGAAFTAGRTLSALLLALLLTGNWDRAGLTASPAGPSGLPDLSGLPGQAAPVLLFALFDTLLVLVDYRLRRPALLLMQRRDLLRLFLLELIPVPFISMAVIAAPLLGAGSLLGLGSLPLIFAILLAGEDETSRDLARKVQELSTLNQVSQVLRSTLDLEKLLAAIHTQVTRLLQVDNFYVALYDEQDNLLWYPLAVKRGVRRRWPTRRPENRLTERVILEGKPVLFGQPGGQNLGPELPASEETPTAWIGVPLITSERVIGCLALFSLDAQVGFTPSDTDLLTTLSGQISVSIENSLLYEQTQRRAAQLETLNHTSALISASLDLQDVLAQVCHAAVRVSDGRRSAIYLVSETEGEVRLAHALALSAEFAARNQAFTLADGERARCLRTGSPVLVSDLCTGSAHARRGERKPGDAPDGSDFLTGLVEEGICAYGNFPLSTPDRPLGILSVYYDRPHSFSADEVELLQTFAAQAALAVANARAYARTDTALSQRVQQLSILEAVGRELAASTHSERLFERILRYALEFTGSPWGMVGLVDWETGAIRPRHTAGYAQRVAGQPENAFPAALSIDQGLAGRAVTTRQPVRRGDIHRDLEALDLTGGQARSHLSLPLLYEGQVLGVLTLEKSQPDGYSAADEAFIAQLANQAAIAVANAQLYSAVSASRDRLAAVLDSVQEGILMVERSGILLLANRQAARYTGMEIQQLEGSRFEDLPPHVLEAIGCSPEEARQWSAALDRGETPAVPRKTVPGGLSGSGISLERSALSVRGESGLARGWMVVLRDITAEEELAQTRELLAETLVHDLRSPLSAVLGALDVLGGELAGESPTGTSRQAHKLAARAARRMMGLVESLLEISRMQAGQMELNVGPVDLPALVETALADFRAQAEEAGVALQGLLPDELPPLYADEAKLVRVLNNLLDNALKYTPSGGEVWVTATAAENGVEVAVADSGPGIPAEYREKIFDRFAQVPGQRSRRRGSGLGLTFCRLAILAHGGRIWMEPRPEGGSRFCFTLPIKGASRV